MTGIAGIIDLSHEGRIESGQVQPIVGGLRHRGPDSEGFFESPDMAFGAARFGIIDLQGSKQPLFNEDRTIALVFDGAIYNYRELREQLKRRNHVTSSDGDGEMIIHLYEEYGLTLFSHLRGMFAFALWDSKAGRLLLAVDHAGMKPLYLAEHDHKLYFASEIKALFANPEIPRRVNMGMLDAYLSFGYMPDEQTLFEGVRRLPPGQVCIVERGQPPALRPYWELPRANRDHRPQPEGILINEARDLLADVVRIHLRSDAPLGILLDNNLESAALLAFATRELGGSIRTFSINCDTETDEYAKRLADHFRADHHEQKLSAADWWRALEGFVFSADEPVANPDALPVSHLAEAAHPHAKTLLTGWGAPAVFGGYPAHYAIPQLLSSQRRVSNFNADPIQRSLDADDLTQNHARIHPTTLTLQSAAARLKPIYDAVFDDDLRKKLYKPDGFAHVKNTAQTFENRLTRSWRDDPYDMAQALVMNIWLAGNAFLSLDRATLAHSIEARVPFFDPTLLKFLANVPPGLRLRDRQYLLREAARPYLPDFALERPPEANSTPLLRWLDNELSANVREVLLNPNAFITEFFNRAALETLLKDHFWGRVKRYEIVFRLLVLELWGQRFIKPPAFSL